MSRRSKKAGGGLHIGRYLAMGFGVLVALSVLMQACGITEPNTEPDIEAPAVVESVEENERDAAEEPVPEEDGEETTTENIVLTPIETTEEPEEPAEPVVENTPEEPQVVETPEAQPPAVETPTPEPHVVETPVVEPDPVVDEEPVFVPVVDDPLSGGASTAPDYDEPTYKEPTYQEPAYQEPIQTGNDYVINVNSGKYHYAWCDSVGRMAEHNKSYYTGASSDIAAMGYSPCENCNP